MFWGITGAFECSKIKNVAIIYKFDHSIWNETTVFLGITFKLNQNVWNGIFGNQRQKCSQHKISGHSRWIRTFNLKFNRFSNIRCIQSNIWTHIRCLKMIMKHRPWFHHVSVLSFVDTNTASCRDLPYLGVRRTVQDLSVTDPDDGGGRFGIVSMAGEV